jgi:hypothetical protein
MGYTVARIVSLLGQKGLAMVYIYEFIHAFFSGVKDVREGKHQFPLHINIRAVEEWAFTCAEYCRRYDMGLWEWLKFTSPKNW